jgi:predicted transcriptional regulator
MVQAAIKRTKVSPRRSPHRKPMLKRSTTDDSRLWDIMLGNFSYQMLLVAHNRKLFPLLAQQPQTLEEIASQLGLAPRPVQAMLTATASMGLIKLDHELL